MKITKAHTTHEVTVPAGTYFLGDPCYPFPHKGEYGKDWSALLNSTKCEHTGESYFHCNPIGEVRGFKILAFNTAYGDGDYYDQSGREYSVDAGLIGLMPKALVDLYVGADDKGYELSTLGQFVKFKSETKCYTMGANDGLLIFGKYRIETDD